MTTPLQLFGLHPIQAVYVTVLVVTILALAGMNYWIKTRASTSRIQTALLHHNVAICWALVAVVGLLVENRQLSLWLVYLRTFLSYATTILFVRFAAIYSGRSTSLRRPVNAVYVAGLGLGLVGLATQPWHGLHFDPLVFHTEPFPYYETGFGPIWQFSLLCAYGGFVVALYYFMELSLKSQHRSSRPLAVYSVGMALSLVPSMLTATRSVPTLPGYDHGVFGLSVASIAFFSGAWLGMVRIAPISRDRLLATTGDALVVVDNRRQVADHNAVAETFFADSDGDHIGAPLADVAPVLANVLPPVADRSAADATDSDGLTVEFAYRAGGRTRQYSMVVSSVTDGDRRRGDALLIREVTDRAERRAELRRQNEQLDEFASSISHYLRNPLQVASGQAELARHRLEADDRDTDTDRLDDLERSLDRMETIITDLRTLAEQGKSVDSTEFVGFSGAVEEAATHIETDDATVSVERDGTIRADKGRLLSILENLLRNSVEHAGPDVSITLRLTEDGFVFRDDGPGIDADHDRLFEYGYTTSSTGTGLGLSIVKTMAESHGWQVRLDSDHDGAGFVITGAVTVGDSPTDDSPTVAP